MNAAMLRVPASIAGDPSDVAVALEVAGALWEKGDNEEAVRWLRRAGEAAGEAGNAARAAALGQAAVELQAALENGKTSAAQEAAPNAVPPTMPAPSAPAQNAPPLPSAPALRASASMSAARGASKPPPIPPAAAAQSVVRHREGRIRVSVKTSVRDPNLLLLRPLAEGQVPPTGTREGFLVLGETDPDARSNANGGGTQ